MEEPLYKILDRERMSKIQSLLSAGKLDVNIKHEEGNTALHEAIMRREPQEFIKILIQAGANINQKNNNGYTAFQLFMESHKYDKLKDFNNFLTMILNAGADVNSQTLNCGMTPLHIAVIESNLHGVKYLLSQGADPRVKCSNGKTPLHYAAQDYRGDPAIIDAILSADCEVSKIRNYTGDTPLHTFARVSSFIVELEDIIKCLKVFQQYNADMNVINDDRVRLVDQAVKAACRYDNFNTLEAFLRLKFIEIDDSCSSLEGENSCTILFAACDRNSLALAKYLLKKGANVNAVDDKGMSILHFVVNRILASDEYFNLLEYLLKWMPNPNTRDVDGDSIMTILQDNHFEFPENPGLRSVMRYMIKFHFLGLLPPLHSEELIDDFFQRFNVVIRNERRPIWGYFSECFREIQQMNRDELPFCDLTFWNLLINKKKYFISYFKNRNLIKYIKEIDIINRYPIYGPEIQEKVDKALKKLSIYQKSAEVLSISFPRRYNLGDLVLKKIVSYCKTKELLRLCE